MPKLDFSTGSFLVGLILTFVLIVLDKAGKLKGPMLLVMLGVAAVLTLPLALNIAWVSDTQGAAKFSRSLLMVLIVGVIFSVIAVWVTNPEPVPEKSTPTKSTPSLAEASAAKPAIKSLHEFFSTDCKAAHALSTYTLVGNDANRTPYLMEYDICGDFKSKTFYISFFLPQSDLTAVACQALPWVQKEIVSDILHGDKQKLFQGIINHAPGAKPETWAELKPSERVFIYHETHLLDEERNKLRDQYKNENLSPQFVGPHELILRNSPLYESSPSSKAVKQPANSIPKIERKGTRGLRLPLEPETNRITTSNYKGEKHNLVACLAKFYYTPEPDTPDWVYVTAHIYFYPGYESYKAFRPIWFETESNKQIFKRADTHELIIVMGGAPVLHGHQRWASYESSDREGQFHFEGVFDEGFRAEVELIIERDRFVAKQIFSYEVRAKGKPNEPSRLWEV